jgi:hypothetical protein
MERKTVGTKYDLMKLFQQAVERMSPEQKAEARKRLDEKLRPWLRKVKSPLSATGTGKRGQITTLDVARELSKYMRVGPKIKAPKKELQAGAEALKNK